MKDREIQDLVDSHQYGKIYKKDEKVFAKVGLDIYERKEKDNWIQISDVGIKNPELIGIPKTLRGYKWSR